jgi:hypothetical protein
MNRPRFPSWIIPLIIAVALPTIACFAYYSLDETNMLIGNNSFWHSVVILAYPTSLLGLTGLVMTHYSPKKSCMKYSAWGACMLLPIVFLLFVRA